MSLRSRTLLAIAGIAATSTLAHAADDAGGDLLRRVQDLDQQIKILARKAELADEAAAEKAKTAVSAKAGPEGFSIGNSDKANPFSVKLGVLAQLDGRFWINDTAAQQSNTFLLRRAQPTLDAQLGKYTRARVQASFNATSAASPPLEILESWLEFKPSDKLALTAGRFKTIGVEYINSSAGLTFPERGLPTNLIPAYDVGASLGGAVSTYGTWIAGVVNGSVDGTTRQTDNDDDKDGFARISLTPFKGGDNDLLKGLNVVLAGTYGYETGTTTAGAQSLTAGYKTPGQVTVFAYNAASRAAGDRSRFAPAIEWYSGPIGLIAEYTSSRQEIIRGAKSEDVGNKAWQVVLSYVLTGETKTAGGVVPKQAFDTEAGTWGAWEVAARIGELRIDDEAFSGTAGTALADPTTQIRKAQSASLAVNWWLTRNLKWQLAGDYTRFDGGGGGTFAKPLDRESERVIVTRVQVNF